MQAGGTLQPPHFLCTLVMEGNSGGYSCSGSRPVLYPRRPASPRKRKLEKSELRPDLPMLTNINYHGCGVRGYKLILCENALAHHRSRRCNLKGRQTHRHRHTRRRRHASQHTPIINKAVDRNGGLLCRCQDRHWQASWTIFPRFVPECEVLSMPRGRSGPFPGGS